MLERTNGDGAGGDGAGGEGAGGLGAGVGAGVTMNKRQASLMATNVAKNAINVADFISKMQLTCFPLWFWVFI